jgi:FkbM family methyltransferase
MIHQIKTSAAKALRGTAQRLDPIAPRNRIPNPLQRSLEVLQSLSFQPKHIVDIGANHGDWTKVALRCFPNANYSLIEPNPQLLPHLTDLLQSNSKISLHQVGIGAENAEFTFNVHPDDTSSSFAFTAERAQSMGCVPLTVPVHRLDTLLSSIPLPPPELIKIDAEGLDLEVLKGAALALSTCQVVFIECAIMCDSMPNDALTVLRIMHDHGFRLFDTSDAVRTPTHKCLWLLEAVFVKMGSGMDQYGIFC